MNGKAYYELAKREPLVMRLDEVEGRILFLLTTEGLSVYDIHKRLGNRITNGISVFDNPLGDGIAIKHPNLYTKVRELEKSGLIKGTKKTQAVRTKTEYRLTDAGWFTVLYNGLFDYRALFGNSTLTKDLPIIEGLLSRLFEPKTIQSSSANLDLQFELFTYLVACSRAIIRTVQFFDGDTKINQRIESAVDMVAFDTAWKIATKVRNNVRSYRDETAKSLSQDITFMKMLDALIENVVGGHKYLMALRTSN